MDLGLPGKKALIAGSTRGIGRAIATLVAGGSFTKRVQLQRSTGISTE